MHLFCVASLLRLPLPDWSVFESWSYLCDTLLDHSERSYSIRIPDEKQWILGHRIGVQLTYQIDTEILLIILSVTNFLLNFRCLPNLWQNPTEALHISTKRYLDSTLKESHSMLYALTNDDPVSAHIHIVFILILFSYTLITSYILFLQFLASSVFIFSQ